MSVYRVGGNKSSQNVFPSVRPTLDLDFANSKTLDPRITFTRASGGSYVGADGLIKYAGVNEARFDHDPSTGESLGLLVEEARTNLLLRSEEFDVVWTTFASSIESTILAPDGTMTGVKLKEDTTQNEHRVGQFSGGGTTTNAVTFSVFLKASERTKVRLAFSILNNWVGGGGAAVIFDLMAGTAIPNNSTPTNFSITPFPNGWYRCSITGTPITTITPNCVIFIYTTTFNYTGDGTSGIYVWGAQLEQGAFPTSYIPTLGSTRTRAADNASITGKNFSEWYRQDEGTVLVNLSKRVPFHTDYINPRTGLVAITQAMFRGIYIDYRKDAIRVDGTSRNSATSFLAAIINTSSKSPNILKSALSYSIINSTFSFISNLSQNVNSQTLSPTVNKDLFIGRSVASGTGSGSQYTNGTISRLTYFPKRLPNEQLIALTR
jgi:hypothetical protein